MNVIVHSADGRSLTVALGRGVVIGRDPTCDVVVDDHLVSRRHAQLEVDPQGHVVLRDLGSRNGTFVDGKRVEGPVVLAGNERIGIGDAELTLASEVESGPRPDSKDPMVGTMLGRYRIDAKIDEGAMGTVYLAEHTRLGKKVALKVMAQRLFRNQVARQRFVDESRVVASLDHPNIIPVFDADEVQDELYIAMRYVDGEDLGHLLDREGALDPNRAISIISQVGAALDAAHAHGLVHRDVKPTNILIASARDTAGEGHAFLVDFGITKNLASSGLTGTGQTLGTPNYMAPEQFRGQPVDGRTDMYALGCLLYECLTGRPPYEGESFETVMYGHLMTPPPSVATQRPGLPPALDAVVSKAMAKDAGERYATSAELVAAARGALASAPAAAMTQPGAAPAGPVATMAAGPAATMASPGERTAGPPPPPPGVLGSPTVAEPVPPGAALGTTGGRGPRSRRTVLIAGGAIAVVAVAVVAVLVLSGGGSSPPDTRIVAAPSGTVHDSKATVRFSADAAGSSFECSLDGTGFTSCTSPLALDSLDDGRHSFRVRAVNGDGKPDATPASASWRVDDTTAPQTDISKGPPDTASTDSATFSFSSSEAGATFDCSLDGGSFDACTSPHSVEGLAGGDHTFEVRATDPAGNADRSPAKSSWTVNIPFPDAAEQFVLDHVNSNIRPSCERASGTPPKDADANVICSEGSVTLFVTHFTTSGDLQSWYTGALGLAGIDANQGSGCPNAPSDDTWHFGDSASVTRGHLLCYHFDGNSWLDWTFTEFKLYASATESTLDDQSLFSWWGSRKVAVLIN